MRCDTINWKYLRDEPGRRGGGGGLENILDIPNHPFRSLYELFYTMKVT